MNYTKATSSWLLATTNAKNNDNANSLLTQIMNKIQNPMFTNHKNMYFQDLHPNIDPANFKRKKQQIKTSNLHHLKDQKH
jgi:hypothetical protein